MLQEFFKIFKLQTNTNEIRVSKMIYLYQKQDAI